MLFNRKKKESERLKASFGRIKENSFDFTKIRHYFKNKDNSGCFQVLSDKTCADLDFEDLFAYMDRTVSKVGQQYLYNKLRVISTDRTRIDLNEEIIKVISEDTDLRIAIQSQLKELDNYAAYDVSPLFQEAHLNPPKWFFIIKILSVSALLLSLLVYFYPQYILALIGVFVVNLGIHFWNKKNLFKYLSAIPQLLNLNRVAFNLHKKALLKKIDPNLEKPIELLNQVRNRMLFFQLEGKLQGDLAVLFWATFELIKTLFLLEPLLLFGVLKRLNTKRREVEQVFSFVGEVDTLISIASLRRGLDSFSIPKISQNSYQLNAESLYHPLLPSCVTNDISVSNKSILLTGSNMSGKTSFIRTIGLNVITGLTINTCFAKSLTIPFTRVFSAIRISDDLLNDKSYYSEEVFRIKEMISEGANSQSNLFLLDEIFKGTNTVERIAAGKAVLSLLSKNNNLVFVSTHDIELTDLLSEEYELYHFSEVVNDKKVGFDYKLKKGKLKHRNAIKILEVNEYPDEVIIEARAIAKELDRIGRKNAPTISDIP